MIYTIADSVVATTSVPLKPPAGDELIARMESLVANLQDIAKNSVDAADRLIGSVPQEVTRTDGAALLPGGFLGAISARLGTLEKLAADIHTSINRIRNLL